MSDTPTPPSIVERLGMRECVVCGCTHLSDELNSKDATIKELAEALNLRVTDGCPCSACTRDRALLSRLNLEGE